MLPVLTSPVAAIPALPESPPFANISTEESKGAEPTAEYIIVNGTASFGKRNVQLFSIGSYGSLDMVLQRGWTCRTMGLTIWKLSISSFTYGGPSSEVLCVTMALSVSILFQGQPLARNRIPGSADRSNACFPLKDECLECTRWHHFLAHSMAAF